jgi:hypothetical protein
LEWKIRQCKMKQICWNIQETFFKERLSFSCDVNRKKNLAEQ